MKNVFTRLCFMALITLLACTDDQANLTNDEVFAIKTIDIDDNQNASDLVAIFEIGNPSIVKEIRIFLIRATDFSAFTDDRAAELPEENYHSVEVDGYDYQVKLPANLNDVEGAKIEKDVNYFIGFILLIGEDLVLNSSVGKAKISEDHSRAGKYVGGLTDNIYDISVSAEFTMSGTTLTGFYYATSDFTSAGKEKEDGIITIELSGEQITSFKFSQNIVNKNGDGENCEGNYHGAGNIENFTTLVINYKGMDCVGSHIGGVLTLRKIFE